jgi:fructokinase
MIFGGIELGGTKIVCAVGAGPSGILDEIRIPTTMPDETLARIIAFLQQYELDAVGIGSFGPVSLDRSAPDYGFITTTPKPGWAQADVVGSIRSALGVPVGFDTDVNAAALGEWRWGAGQGLDAVLYLTIGTGIGGGGILNGKPMHGLLHPEMGHIRLPHDLDADPFAGICPYHSDCLEGLASGPALHERWGESGKNLPDEHPAWILEAHYLSLACVNFICTLSPQRIILGGGVMHQRHLFSLIRQEVQRLLNGYVQVSAILDHIDDYIVPPSLGEQVGVLGALALAEQAVREP